MNSSEHLDKLAPALSKLQGAIPPVKRESANPFFKSKYASLETVWEAVRQPLEEHGFSVVQTTEEGDGLTVTVVTTLLHSSGQWIGGKLTLKPQKPDPQGIGSAITYARRYALMSVLGIATEDDDGNHASQPPRQEKRRRENRQLETQTPSNGEGLTDKQLYSILSEIESSNSQELRQFVERRWKPKGNALASTLQRKRIEEAIEVRMKKLSDEELQDEREAIAREEASA